MNTRNFTAAGWIERGSLWLAGATLLGSATLANSGENEVPAEIALPPSTLPAPGAMDDLREALLGGTFWASLRYRYENVDQPGFLNKDAHASTLQTRLGYRSGSFHGLSGVIEFSNVSNVGASNHDYDSTPPGTPLPHDNDDRPRVADPVGTQVNQVYVDYSADVGDLRVGRQRIQLDNDRFIGNVGWRQTEQTYDAISYNKNWRSGLRVYYAYLDNVNNIFQENDNTSSHLLNVSNSWENIGRLTAYGYYLDFEHMPQLSTFSYGGRFAGGHSMGDWGLLYTLEYAQQKDAEENPNQVDATYSHVNFGGEAGGAHLKLGFESLEGSPDANAFRSFQTPLATKHGHNGWADQFLTIPAAGLEDTYADLGFSNKTFRVGIVLHQFEAEQNSGGDFGDELDIYGSVNLAEDITLGAKFADFDAETNNTVGYVDTQKVWVWLALSF